jgi:hypothetical protein
MQVFRDLPKFSHYTFLDPNSSYLLPASFDFREYIEAERELWALFPETDGKRVNFVQIGLSAQIFTEMPDDRSELGPGEVYLLMPCADQRMRPIRMKSLRRLTLAEYRMGHLTALKLMGRTAEASEVMREIGCVILGDEVLCEVDARVREGEC